VARENHLTTVAEVTHYTKAGGGCQGCHPKIEAILKKLWAGEAAKKKQEPAPNPKKLTNLQKIRLIEETLEREVIPPLRSDGGDLELLDIDGNTVYVALRGSCSFCPMSDVTLKKYVEVKLKEFVHPDIVVEEVKS
jgi:NifU-like protein